MPLITNDAVVLGLLMALLGFVFYTNQSQNKFWKKFYNVVPALLLCYFLPAIFNSVGIISGDESNLYFIASRFLLPAALILLCLSIDLQAVLNLGPKALIMFVTATLGIVIGGPVALAIVGSFAPEAVGGEGANAIWRGLATVAGSWIGGGANQTAMKEIYGASDTLFSAMIVVDVFVANIWMAVLLYWAGRSEKVDKVLKSDTSAIESLRKKVEDYHAQIAKIPTMTQLMLLLALIFTGVGLAHLLSDTIAPGLSAFITQKISANPDSGWKYITSIGSGFFWLVVVATTIGVVLSFTKARSMEGYGASKIGGIFIYVLVATIGMKMDIAELINQWQVFKYLILVGLIWMAIHVTILLVVAKIIRAPFFFVAVGSQANVGGAASAPVVASAFAPALAPVGVLLAVLGYALGTFGAILCATLLQTVAY